MSLQNDNPVFDLIKTELNKIHKNITATIPSTVPTKTELTRILNAKSKCIRSVVAILYLKSLGLKISKKHYELFTAVELVHNASLIHDDVIDESQLRRNQETLNSKFDNKTAVIGGDYIISLAIEKIIELNSPEILIAFVKTFQKMCLGEFNQLTNLFKVTTIEEYITKSIHKTSNLFKTTLESALLISGIDVENAPSFAQDFGTAFQISDDLSNVIGSQTSSKPTNNDIQSGIYTAPIILGGGVDNIQAGIEKTKLLLNNYIQKAINELSDLTDETYKKALISLTKELSNV